MMCNAIINYPMNTPTSPTPPVKPLPFWQALLFFAIPALVLVFAVYWVLPSLAASGLPVFTAYMVALLIPLVLMLIAALVAYRLEGRPLTWAAFADRFRLRRMTGKDWLWTLVGAALAMAGFALFLGIARALVASGLIPLPADIPAPIDPRLPTNDPNVLLAMFGPSAVGNWGLVALAVVLIFFNIIGEEFWWRGYILPRQQLVHGRWTWLIHGVLWTLFHAFKYWDWLALLPVCLILSYIAQKRQNTWPGIIIHFVVNGSTIFLVLAVVLGVLGK